VKAKNYTTLEFPIFLLIYFQRKSLHAFVLGSFCTLLDWS